MSRILPNVKWAGQLNSNLATMVVRDFKASDGVPKVGDKLGLCKKWASELGLGTVDPEGKRTRRHLHVILGDFRTGYELLRDNAELGSDPLRVTAANIEYVRKSCEVFDILEPVFVKHLFGENALRLSSKRSGDPPSDAESEAEGEDENDSERLPEGDDEAGNFMGVDDGTYAGVVQVDIGKGEDALLERCDDNWSFTDC
jgi:hypothetical protein